MKKTITLAISFLLAVMMIGTTVFADEAVDAVSEDVQEIAEENAIDLEDDYGIEGLESEDIVSAPENLITVDVNLSEEGEILIEDYSTIEIPASAVLVTDLEVQNYIDSILSYSTTQDAITEGTVEEGDSINIDFSGVLDGEEEPFDGGTAQGYDVVSLGAGTFIEGFEEQIIGHEIGETFDIYVTFPEEYTADLAGKDAIFTITINYKTETVVPELTDEFVQQFSAENLNEQLNTVEELEIYTYDYLYRNYLQEAIMNAMTEKETVITYKQDLFELMKAYSSESLSYYTTMYTAYGLDGVDVDTLAQMSGYATADDYTNSEAMYYCDMIMLLDKIAADNGIEITEEEVDETIADYMASYGYDEVYTIDEFKELSGEAWVVLIRSMQVEYEKDMDVLISHVSIVDDTADADISELDDADILTDVDVLIDEYDIDVDTEGDEISE